MTETIYPFPDGQIDPLTKEQRDLQNWLKFGIKPDGRPELTGGEEIVPTPTVPTADVPIQAPVAPETAPVIPEAPIVPSDGSSDLRSRLGTTALAQGIGQAGQDILAGMSGSEAKQLDFGVGDLRSRIAGQDKDKAAQDLARIKSSGKTKEEQAFKFAKVVDKDSKPLYTKQGVSGFFRQSADGKFEPVNPLEVSYPASMSTEKKMRAFRDSSYVDELGNPLNRVEKTGRYYTIDGEEYTGKKFGKDQAKYLRKLPTGVTQHQKTRLLKESEGFETRAGRLNGRITSSNLLMEILNSPSRLKAPGVKTQLPRLLGEVGNLNEFEQKAWSGDPSYKEGIKRWIRSKFNTNLSDLNEVNVADLTDADIRELSSMVRAVGSTLVDTRNSMRAPAAKRLESDGLLPSQYEALLEPSVPFKHGQPANTQTAEDIKDKKTVVKKFYSPKANKTKLQYSDGSEEVVDGQR